MQTAAALIQFLLFAFSATVPAFGLVLVGLLARRFGLIGDRFVEAGARLVFRVGLPVVLFFGAVKTDYSELGHSRYLLAGVLSTLLTVVLALGYARWRGFALRHRGIFAQGAYRSNMGIIGIALCANAYGDTGLALAAMPVAVWTTLYNVIAVIVLNLTLDGRRSPWAMLLGMVSNPLILGIAAGAAVSLSGLTMPPAAFALGKIFTASFLPFALVCIGGALQLAALRASSRETVDAAIWKLLLAPLFGVLVAIGFGVRGAELGVLFLLLAAPTASASFVMVVAAGGNGALAANIVVLTTLGSAFSVTLGLFALRLFGLI